MSMEMVAEDRLSLLPDDIIHHILSFLPMDAAIRTSTLSKRWLHQWKFINMIHISSLPEFETEMDYGFLDRSLALMRATNISKFIMVAHLGALAEPNFANWISFAVAKHVASLEFYMIVDAKSPYWEDWTSRDEYFELPDSFYLRDTESRKEIALSCVDFSPPTPELGFQGYKLLTRLFLYDSSISDEGLQSVMSTCRILESLSIIKCWGLRFPKISSLTLQEFVFTKYHDMSAGLQEFSLDAPNLLSLNAYCRVGEITVLNKSCYPMEVRLLGGRRHEQFGKLFDAPVADSSDSASYNYNPSLMDDDTTANLGDNYDIKRCLNTIGLMKQLARVQFFGITDAYIPLIKKSLHFNGGPCNIFSCLKEFYFCCVCQDGVQRVEVVVLLTFLGDLPSLTKIQIEFDLLSPYPTGMLPVLSQQPDKELVYRFEEVEEGYEYEHPFEELDDEEEVQVSKANTLNQLKLIELYYYYGANAKDYCGKAAVDLVRRLLLKAVCLERLSLFYEPPKHHILQDKWSWLVTPLCDQQQLHDEISLLPRASPCAEILLGS